MSACSSDLETAELVPIDQDVGQVILQNLFQKLVARTGDRPTVFLVVIDDQAVSFGGIPELSIVVGVTSTAILNALHIIVVVNHLVQEGGCHFLNGSGESSCADVDFVGATDFRNPGVLSQGEVSVGFWRGLDGDGGS